MDEPNPIARFFTAIVVLAGVVLLLPITLLIATSLYCIALFEGCRYLARRWSWRKPARRSSLPRPHLLAMREGAKDTVTEP